MRRQDKWDDLMPSKTRARLKDIAQYYSRIALERPKNPENKEKIRIQELTYDCNVECLQILSYTKSNVLKGVELLTLATLLKALNCIPYIDRSVRLRESIADVIITMHSRRGLGLQGCTGTVFGDLTNDLYESHLSLKKSLVFGSAVAAVADILNDLFTKGELEWFKLESLSCICFSLSRWDIKSINHIELLILNIARVTIKLYSRNKLEDKTGDLLANLVGQFTYCYTGGMDNTGALLIASHCIAKYLIARFNKDELLVDTITPQCLTRLICSFCKIIIPQTEVEEGVIKYLFTVFAKTINSRVLKLRTGEFDTYNLLTIAVKFIECIAKLDDKTTMKSTLKNISEAIAEKLEEMNYRTKRKDLKLLMHIVRNFIALSEEGGKECLKPAIVAAAKLAIERHRENRLQMNNIQLLIDLSISFGFWNNREHTDKTIILEAILAIANSFITKYKNFKNKFFAIDYSTVIHSFSIWMDYDRRQSLKTAIEIIANIILEYYTIYKELPYDFKKLCILLDGFTKWYGDRQSINSAIILIACVINVSTHEFFGLSPHDLSTLAKNYIQCYDNESNEFQLGIHIIAQTVSKHYYINFLIDYNAVELSLLTSAFLKLFANDDLKESVRDAMICIAQSFTSRICQDNGEFGSMQKYLHIFANAFSIWCRDENDNTYLTLAIKRTADLICSLFEQNNLSGFTISQLSIISEEFRKFPIDTSTYQACSMIAKYIVLYRTKDLFECQGPRLVLLLKTFSSWSENEDQEGNFQLCSETIANVMFAQLRNVNYSMICSCEDLVSFIYCCSKWYRSDREQCMQHAAVAIATCINNEYVINTFSSWSLKDLGKLTIAYSYWSESDIIQQSVNSIADKINKIDKNMLKVCKTKYLKYFLAGFEKFFSIAYDDQCSKSLAIAASYILKALRIEDLKGYDKDFLSRLDQYFSRFSEDWECHEAALIIRQLDNGNELIFGKTVFDIFIEVRKMDDDKLERLLLEETNALSKLAFACSSFLHLDDSCLTLRRALTGIARSIPTDGLEVEEDSALSGNSTCSIESETVFNFIRAFGRCPQEKDIQQSMSAFSSYLVKCNNQILSMFDSDQLLELTLLLRSWCDNFPGLTMNEYDKALKVISKHAYNIDYRRLRKEWFLF